MSWWRRYLDLWIVGALLCGLFAFRHGGVTLASIGPRVGEITTFVTTTFAEFTSTVPAVAEGAADSPLAEDPPVAGGIAAVTPAIDAVPDVVRPTRLRPIPSVRPLPGPGFVPFCPEAYGHCCPR